VKKPSPSIHEGYISRLQVRDASGELVPDEALQAAESALARARASAERMFAIAESISLDPSIVPAIRPLKIRDAVGAVAIASAKALDQQRAIVAAELAALREATSAPPPPADATAVLLQQEIRARLATMDNPRRGELLHRAVIDGDDQIIGALLHAPGWLSNVTDAEREMRREAWRHVRHPQHVKLLIEYAQSLIDNREADKVEQATAATARAMAS
jgi:hypothetical protein